MRHPGTGVLRMATRHTPNEARASRTRFPGPVDYAEGSGTFVLIRPAGWDRSALTEGT